MLEVKSRNYHWRKDHPRHFKKNGSIWGPRPARHKFEKRTNKEGKRLYAPYGYLTTKKKFGKLLTWKEMTPVERGVTSRRIMGIRHLNRLWKAQGYPNLKKADAARRKYREERIAKGELPGKRAARLEQVAKAEAEAVDANEARDAEIWASGKLTRLARDRQTDGTRPLLGGLIVAGNYDPEYLMRREMRILEVMSRCPTI